MSAAVFGANLLEEVQEESLDKLLYDLRYSIDTGTTCSLGILELDRLLDLFCHSHHPDRGSHLRDATSHSGVRQELVPEPELTLGNDVSDASKLIRGPILIEIVNTPSSTGGINLLYHITAASILPRKHRGKEATVVWLDCKLSFSAVQLYDVCIKSLSLIDNPLPLSERQKTAEDALKHVHVFSISSSRQLAAVLDGLQDYLLQTDQSRTDGQKHYSMHRPLSLVILDSATAFHWTDRFDAEIARLEAIKAPLPNPETQPQPQPQIQEQAQTQSTTTATQLITKLKTLQAKFDNICIYTTTPPTTSNPQTRPRSKPRPSTTTTNPDLPPPPTEPDHLPSLSPWTYAATLSLTLSRIPIPQFASHMTLNDCLRDRAKRQEVVRLNRMRVAVNEEWLSSVVRDKEVRRAITRMDGRGGFVFRVGERGVEIER